MIRKSFIVLFSYQWVFTAVYLVGAFVAWDINPAYWSEGGRVVFAIAGTCFGTILAIITVIYDSTKEQL